MSLSFAIITDLHFGPEGCHEGKLRKMSHQAPFLTEAFVREMNERTRPDMIVNLGDDIEDENRDLDLQRYEQCQNILRKASAKLVNVAGNHDLSHLGREDLNRIWERSGPLHYSFEHGGWHFVVLHTIERKDVEIRVPPSQLEWLREDLRECRTGAIVLMHHSASEQDLEDSRWFHGRPHLALVKERSDLRRIFEESGKVRAVFNGHVHRNHFDLISGIPYITVQSLIENLDDDAPGRAAAAHGLVTLSARRIAISVRGSDPARYQVEL